MRRKNRVLLADGDSDFSTRVARSLAMDSGFQTYAVSTVAQTALRYSRSCHRFKYHSVSDGSSTESLAQRLLARAKELEIDVVLAVQNAIPVLSTHRSLFESAGVYIAPKPAIEAYGITVDKGAFARRVAAHDLPHPRTVVLDGRVQTRPDLDSLKYPLLYKPCRAGYGHGIRRLQDESSVCEFLEGQKKPVKHGIFQEGISGEDVDCSVICVKGKVIVATVQRPLLQRRKEFGAAVVVELVENDRVVGLVSELIR